jgi:hypothetical protein
MDRRPLTVPEAAELLDVGPQRVHALVRAGELAAERAAGVWLVDADAVVRRSLLNTLGVMTASARPWSEPIAWAVMRALDGDDTSIRALDRTSQVRVGERIRDASGERLLAAVRNRGTLVRVSVHPTRLDALRELVVPSGVVGAGVHGLGMSGEDLVDGYVEASVLDRARTTLGVRESSTGAHILRVVADARVLSGLDVAPRLAVAADLIDHAVSGGVVDGRVVSAIRTLLGRIRPAESAR